MPILRQRGHLIALLPAVLSDEELADLRDRLADEVGRQRVDGVVLDVSGLDVMDSYSARSLRELALVIRLRGAEAVVVEIQPEVAFAMVQLGLRLNGVTTALDLEEGIAYLDSKGRRGYFASAPQWGGLETGAIPQQASGVCKPDRGHGPEFRVAEW